MQSACGGWGSFDVDNDRRVMTQIPLCDFGEVIDPPTEDVTAHVVEALVQCGLPPGHPAVRRGVGYLWRTQRDDGSWWGRWGVNHVYGTGAVLPALAAAREDMSDRRVRRAVGWLADHQNADGGWGESVLSYRDPAWVGRGDSTASQTAWALLGLLAAEPGHAAVERRAGLPRAHPAARRLLGRALVHRDRLPDGLHDQLPPLPPDLPGDRAGEGPAVTAVASEGQAAARAATRAHDENFPVAFLLASRDVRADMRAVYAFCRATDDLGDEGPGGPGERLAALDAWEDDLRRAVAGGEAADPRLAALAEMIARRGLPLGPFLRLIEANRMDQRRARWGTHEDLLDYCRHSATPVGEMVLGVLGYRDPWRVGMSDATCIGLQLVNFWQDIARDLRDRDRIYLPAEDMERFGVAEDDLRRPPAGEAVRRLVAFEVERARAYLLDGAPLHRFVPRRVSLDLRMFSAGGLALCDAIARQGYDTLARRPAPGRLGRARIAAAAARRALGPGR